MSHLTATLPTSWAEVPLLPFCRLLAAKTLTDQVAATAELVGIEPELLLADFKAYTLIKADLGFMSELPPAQDALPEILHDGVLYHFIGAMDRVSVGQVEALTEFLREHEAQPVLAAPQLLSVLYKPAGMSVGEWDAKVIEATAKAFASLPVAVAWPAFVGFTMRFGKCATAFHQWLVARNAMEKLMVGIEAALPPLGDSPGWWQKRRNAVIRRWIQSVRKLL